MKAVLGIPEVLHTILRYRDAIKYRIKYGKSIGEFRLNWSFKIPSSIADFLGPHSVTSIPL